MSGLRAAVVLALLAACRSSPEPAPAGPTTTPPAAPTFAAAVQVTERTVDGTELAIKPTQPLVPVDERSTLQLTFDATKLRAIVGSPGVPPMDAAEAQMRARLQALLDGLADLLRRSRLLQQAVGQARATGTADAALLTQLVAQDEQWQAVVTAARDCFLDDAREAGLDIRRNADGDYVDARTADFMAQRGAELLPPGRMIDPEVFGAVIQRQLARLDGVNARAAAAAGASSGVTITVRAYLHAARVGADQSKPVRVHVDNYDDLDRGVDIAKPAVGGFTDEDLAELRRRYQLTSDFARTIEAFRDDPERLWQQLGDDLDTLGRQLAGLAAADFAQLLRDLAALVQQNEALAGRVRRLAAFRDRVESVARAVQSLRDALRGPDPDLAGFIRRLSGALDAAWTELTGALDELRNLADLATGADLAAFVAALQGEALTRGKDTLARLRQATVEGLAQSTAIGPVVATLSGVQPWLTLNARLADLPVPKDDPSIGHGIEAAPPATIYLHATPAGAGDRLVVLMELSRPQDTARRLPEHRQSFQVVRRGLRDSLDANLLFVDRLHDSGPTDEFVAAPSVSWTMHYRKLTALEDAANAHGWAGLWNTVNPGIGINVSALNFQGSDVEVGIGAHITLFGDILQAGYGRNLNVADGEEFFFLGIGIIDSLGALGLNDR